MLRSSREVLNAKGWILSLLMLLGIPGVASSIEPVSESLFLTTESLATPPPHFASFRSRTLRIDGNALQKSIQTHAPLELELFADLTIVADRERLIRNRSGSVSWIGKVRGEAWSSVVLVSREGITQGSIRHGRDLYVLFFLGKGPDGEPLHGMYEVDESAPMFDEDRPTEVTLESLAKSEAALRALQMKVGQAPQDDGSIHDLLVVYTPAARDEVGGVVAIETLIDLGVTETNLSYETSNINHRVNLVHVALVDFDESTAGADPRDLLQDPNDGVMDEIHPLRDEYKADLVKLVYGRGGCGRAFIMSDVSLAFEAFAFCRTSYVCVSPGYTFQHELGHIQGGRHQRIGNDPENMPFTFNFGYLDTVNEFRTIMATNDSRCPTCTRRLAWSNPDVNDAITGAPMGIAERDPAASDNRKTLNMTGWTVANFRVSNSVLFNDDFESGDLNAWAPGSLP